MYIYIGGWGDLQPGNSFGSCASVIPRLGFFSSFVFQLRTRARALRLPNAIPMQNQKCKVQLRSWLPMQNDSQC